ncbi:hypothetical protein HZF24_07075 [Sedimentibacter hydroxybenzoicus DSM 7310]|uniref:Uncharacterized protein n=1 Tax=Sedimentibacter hydroxybenzoicus DSM 7310 TaxID=1123245 RepID=A0A974GWB9_SEDHY|nr:hypothetical protein [Sedimentibacter hydroxybenzoicus]NYB73900.1 hypothetical protein [Sedimentibacter hydroxybenzoicus DSM 7310]
MSFFSNLFRKNKEEELSIVNTDSEITNEDEITAVIAAAVASMDEEEETVAAITAAISCILGKSTSEFIVRNITRTHGLDSVWALKGRMKLMR